MADKKPEPTAEIKPGGTAAQPPRTVSSGDDEMDTAAKVFRLINRLDADGRRRIVGYLADRFLPKPGTEAPRGT